MEYSWIEYVEEEEMKEGLYAIHYFYDVVEGSFIDKAYYDGEKWNTDKPIYEYAGPFQSQKAIDYFMNNNNPTW